jgi:hypothetical protein
MWHSHKHGWGHHGWGHRGWGFAPFAFFPFIIGFFALMFLFKTGLWFPLLILGGIFWAVMAFRHGGWGNWQHHGGERRYGPPFFNPHNEEKRKNDAPPFGRAPMYGPPAPEKPKRGEDEYV